MTQKTGGLLRAGNSAELAKAFHVNDVVSTSTQWPNELTFSATRLRSDHGMPDRTLPGVIEPAILISVVLAEIKKGACRYWVRGREINVPFQPRYSICINDMEDNPAGQILDRVDSIHYYVPRASLKDIADDLGISPLGRFSGVFYDCDPFMAQFSNAFLPHLVSGGQSELLMVDYLALLLGAHLLQQYGRHTTPFVRYRGGLSTPQRRRATELLRENLAGRITMKTLANECGLSVSYFARAFKTSFGISVHKWLVQQRIERAKELMLATSIPLADVALRSGFADQPAFTRTFVAAVDVTPGRWRRMHSKPTRFLC